MYLYIVVILIASQLSAQTNRSFSQISEFNALNLSYQHFLKGELNRSLTIFENGKTDVDAYNAAYLHLHLNNFQSAATFAELALTKNVTNDDIKPWANFLLSEIFRKSNQDTKQAIYLKKALKESDSFAEFYFSLGDYYIAHNKEEKALEAYTDGLDINEEATAYHVKAAKLIEKESVSDAIEYLEDLDGEIYPEDDFLIYLGKLYLKKNKKKKARKQFQKYLQFYPFGSYKSLAISELKLLSEIPRAEPKKSSHNSDNYKIRFGEKLVYGVSYLFKLGEMSIEVHPDTIVRNTIKSARIMYALESGTIGLNSVYEVYIDLETLNSLESILLNRSDDEIPEIKTYVFNHEKREFTARVVNVSGRINLVKKEMPFETQDGTGILYFARGLVANKKSMAVTTVIGEQFKLTDIYFRDYLDEEEALGKEDLYKYIDAKAHYKGVAGMNGDAKGWFSNDGEFTPLVGKMSIIIGSVRVELDKKE